MNRKNELLFLFGALLVAAAIYMRGRRHRDRRERWHRFGTMGVRG